MKGSTILAMVKEGPIYVADHDGTLTDPDKEAVVYEDIYLSYLGRKFNISRSDIEGLMAEAKGIILSDANKYGWLMNGFIVAPAGADYTLFAQTALRLVMEKLRRELVVGSGVNLPDEGKVEEFMYEFFATTTKALGEAGNFYRAGVLDCIRNLSAAGKFVVVTNSKPDTVRAKLAAAFGDKVDGLRLVGNAKKYLVDPSWKSVVPEGAYKGFPGFPERGVFLQRKMYFDTLMTIAGGDFKRIAGIFGDIPELDNLMVDYQSTRTALAIGDAVSPWELAYYLNNSDGQRFASRSLGEIADWLIGR